MALYDVVAINHDGMARNTLYRRTVPEKRCAECGQHGRFQYANQPDDQRRPLVWDNAHAFCSVACFRSFWGLRLGTW